MTAKADMIARFADANAWVPGRRIRIDFGGADGAILLDGVDCTVDESDAPPDAVLHVSWSDWLALGDGTLKPAWALLSGRMRIEGDMLAAMQLPGALGKVTP